MNELEFEHQSRLTLMLVIFLPMEIEDQCEPPREPDFTNKILKITVTRSDAKDVILVDKDDLVQSSKTTQKPAGKESRIY